MPTSWTRIRARLNRFAPSGYYTAYQIDENEYVGRLNRPMNAVRSFLRRHGYGPQRLSAAKAHPSATKPFRGDELHALSYRRIPDEHPTEWTVSKWRPEQCQYHVHAFEHRGKIELYSHYELRPLPSPVADERSTTAVERARTHYKPKYGTEYLRGVTDLDLSAGV